MDPNTHRGPEEYGEQGAPDAPPASASADRQGGSGGLARVVRLVSGNFLVTVNPVDGSEIQPCPPGERPALPEKLDQEERAEAARAAAPPVPSGPVSFAGHDVPLEERDEDVDRLVRLLTRGRSVRVTGPSGSGRTRLLDAVAGAVADLAPDGVIRLSGYHRGVTDVLQALYAAVYRAPLHRPDRPELLRLLGGVGAIVVVDDLEFGGAALDELLDATPECAFLLAATPDVPAPSADSHLEEVFVGGISRNAGVRLLERAVGRPLTADEDTWAADLWFESEGLPLRFVQAASLLRHRERARTAPGALDDGYGLFPEEGADAAGEPGERPETPLPPLDEAAAPAALLAERLGGAAQETLRFAVALNGELPHQAHLPALTQDTHADAALGELLGSGLISPAGTHYRLAGTVRDQLAAAGYAEGAAARAHTAAQHYAWWAGHPSVTPERTAAESDAVLAAMGVLTGSRDSGHPAAAVLLARTAAPAFAAALHWSAWERSLRHGQEAARLAGEVAEEAYFHHELGVLALCSGNIDRARAELEASIGLRGVLSDRDGAVAGRRALALVIDRARAASANAATTVLKSVGPGATGATAAAAADAPDAPGASQGPDAGAPDAVSTAKLKSVRPAGTGPTVIARGAAAATAAAAGSAGETTAPTAAVPAAKAADTGTGGARRGILRGSRRNLVAAGAGVLLAAALGTVVTLGATSGNSTTHDNHVTTEQSSGGDGLPDTPAQEPGTGSGLPGASAGASGTTRPGTPGHRPTPAPSTGRPGTTGAPTGGPGSPTTGPTRPTGEPTTPTGRPTHPTHSPTGGPTTSPTGPTGQPTTTPTGPTGKPTGQTPSQSAGGPSGNSPSGTNAAAAPATGTGDPASASGQGTPTG
ncbi:ATPase AAA [Streptomyces albospinus]|uniref:ATPase AAA n=1 Tax=Streptomyces albospinus TaxID=285515 RepID=A0ABQ2UP66_9ACTN|nr:ATP-binding protein [Streptomyces albospinus]GGU43804.1 ATPase AAA [Streptomyces albospinus]